MPSGRSRRPRRGAAGRRALPSTARPASSVGCGAVRSTTSRSAAYWARRWSRSLGAGERVWTPSGAGAGVARVGTRRTETPPRVAPTARARGGAGAARARSRRSRSRCCVRRRARRACRAEGATGGPRARGSGPVLDEAGRRLAAHAARRAVRLEDVARHRRPGGRRVGRAVVAAVRRRFGQATYPAADAAREARQRGGRDGAAVPAGSHGFFLLDSTAACDGAELTRRRAVRRSRRSHECISGAAALRAAAPRRRFLGRCAIDSRERPIRQVP